MQPGVRNFSASWDVEWVVVVIVQSSVMRSHVSLAARANMKVISSLVASATSPAMLSGNSHYSQELISKKDPV